MKTSEEPPPTKLEHTNSRFTKVLVKNLRVGSVELAQEALSLLGGSLAVQIDALEQIPQLLPGGVPGGISVRPARHLVAEHGS